MAADLTLYLDPSNVGLVSSLITLAPVTPPPVVLGDSVTVEIYAPQSVANFNTAAGQIGIGQIDAPPTGGTVVYNYNGNNSAAVGYNANATTLQTALTSINSGPAVTVSGSDGGPYLVTWNAVGSTNALTAYASALYPSSTVLISQDQAGNATTVEREVIRIGVEATSSAIHKLFSVRLNR